MCDTAQAGLKGKFLAVNAYIRKEEKFPIKFKFLPQKTRKKKRTK